MNFPSKRNEQGSVLFAALIICIVTGTILASYLTLTSGRYKISSRSANWNSAVPVLEAGIEEALTHLHDDTNSPGANGWTPSIIGGVQVYTKQRYFDDGSFFFATIYNAVSNNPIVYSQGFVLSPLSTNQYITRMVRIVTTNQPNTFTKAIACTGSINLHGGGVVDGYNSLIGGYDTSTNRDVTGNIATDSNANPAVNCRSGHVYGNVETGPIGAISSSGTGAVGDSSWNTNHSGIEAGWTNNDMNVAFPSNTPPSGSFLYPTVTSSGGSNVLYLPSGAYQLSGFSSTNNTSPMIVTGNAVLWVTGDFTVQTGGYVEIMPGASLTLCVSGFSDIAGGGVLNDTGLPSNFNYVGLSSNTSMSYTGSSRFIGTINAPQAATTINGGSSFYGAIISKSLSLWGNLHYDESLAAANSLLVASWTEL